MCRPRRRSSEWPRCRRCRDCCRRSLGCGSAGSGSAAVAAAADSGCAAHADDADGADGADGGCVMTTEFRNPRSRCRSCSRRKIRRRVLHHRNHHQRRSCRCLSIVPPWESADGGRGRDCEDGGSGWERDCAPPRRSRRCTKSRCWNSRSDTLTGTDRMRSCLSLGMSL